MIKKNQQQPKPLMDALKNPRSPVSEAFRTLRTNIHYTGVDKKIKSILIAGANPACGKTTATANLGVTLAQTGSSVLLIDADLRKPALHRSFGLSGSAGLTNLIVDKNYGPEKVIQRTALENLFVLPCGPVPPYPAELLSSEKMENLVGQLAERFEYLVFDSPPVMVVTDASILSRLVDGTVLVIDHGRVTREEAIRATEQLKKVHANMLGAVFNQVPYSDGYYSYYYYYASEGQENKKKRKSKT